MLTPFVPKGELHLGIPGILAAFRRGQMDLRDDDVHCFGHLWLCPETENGLRAGSSNEERLN